MASRAASTVTRQRGRSGGPRSGGRAWLRVVYPPELTRELRLDPDGALLGREAGASTLVLDHPTVSRRHARIERSGTSGSWRVCDLGSHNGSAVEGVPLGPDDSAPLGEGGLLRLGDVLLVLESAPAGTPPDDVPTEEVPGASMAARALRQAVERAAPDPAPVLVLGETGTGKERVARELHRLSGRAGRFIAVNCAALSPQLIESELFGHVRGAFTGAAEAQTGLFRGAHGGSLLLDEIGDLPLELQAKLLRVIQEGEVFPVGSARGVPVDVRVLSATHRDLATAATAGTFRLDLYARLALWEIRVPPLRERRADLLGWVSRLHARWRAARPGTTPPIHLDADAAETVLLHRWPDNLRGVERLVHELGVRPAADLVGTSDLPAWLPRISDPSVVPARRPRPSCREELEETLREHGGSVPAVARHYGRSRRQVYRWMQGFGIETEQEDEP